MTNREIAQEISSRIGNSPVPFDSVYSIALQIYNELGGEETQFDSVYSILLEILPLVEGGGGKAIEEVDELPSEASENTDKFFRLNSDEKNVYVAKLLDSYSEYSDKLPDEQQIDKAFLFENELGYYYKGAYKIICADGELDWYFWWSDGLDPEYFYGFATEDNAVNANNDTVAIWVDRDDPENWPEVTNTYARTEKTIAELIDAAADTLNAFGQTPIPAIYNAPESAQINWNATILDDQYGTSWWYTGEEASVEVDGETITGYKWIESYSSQPSGDYIISTKKASEIYYFGLTEDNIAFNSDTFFYYWNGEQVSLEYPSKVNICTLNASNAEQVGNAYFTSKEYSYHPARTYFYHYNNEVTVHCTDGDMLMYNWMSDFGVGAITLKEPTYIYRKVEAVSTESWTPGILEEETGEYIYSSTKSALISEFNSQNKIRRESDIPDVLPDIQGQIKYQREEVIEEWDWANILEGSGNQVINGTADLIYNQDMSISTIENVIVITDVDITTINKADAHFVFTLKAAGTEFGSVEANGTFSKSTLNAEEWIETFCNFTFPYLNLQTQSNDILIVGYNTADNNWTIKLMFASQNQSAVS